ncbi:MAG TPA: enoyl-CoA hydratase/isomerase family protein [Longimicrobiales bacterium]|nr:enoyl-CoA hydratase/isomerase family protein [Longimicrobiales bacterium]
MAYKNIRIEKDDTCASVILDRDGGNLLSIDVMDELNDALLELRNEDTLDVLVLRGSGDTFCEGLDLAEHRRERLQRLLQVYSRIFETIRMIDMVTIAAVRGKAWGSGFEIALGCNLIVAEQDASFRLPEIERGVIPHIASIILPRVVPRRRAMEWILTGNEIPASELHRFGLINRLYPADAFNDGVSSFVRELTAKSGPVLQLAKRAQYEAYYSTYEEALYRVQNLYMRELMELEDPGEGIRAHLEGREPVWKNR